MGKSSLSASRASARAAIVVFAIASVASAGPRDRPPGALAPSTTYAAFVMAKIAGAAGFSEAPTIYRAPVAAAHAVFVDGREAVVYNPSFLDAVNHRAGTPWAAVSVIAHELGHHYYGHAHEPVESLPPDVLREHELEADYFSGFVLAQMGASLEDAEAAQHAFFEKSASPTHPDSYRRMSAIAAGWSDGSEGATPASDPAKRLATEASTPNRSDDRSARLRTAFPTGEW